MQYNLGYRKLSTGLNTPSTVEPTPATREGTRALVDRYWALARQVGVGGVPHPQGSTTLVPLPTKIYKSHSFTSTSKPNCTLSSRHSLSPVFLPQKNQKSLLTSTRSVIRLKVASKSDSYFGAQPRVFGSKFSKVSTQTNDCNAFKITLEVK